MKKLLTIALVALLSFSLFAQGGSESGSAVKAQDKGTEITLVFADGDEGAKKSFNEIVNRFNSTHPGMTVTIQPGNGGNY